MSILPNIPTGAGDILHSVLDRMLPKQLQFLGGAAGGYLDLQTGNPVGAAKNFIDAALDMKDLMGALGQNGKNDGVACPQHSWSYEPPPPACCGGPARQQNQINVTVNVGQGVPPPRTEHPSSWRGTPPAGAPAGQPASTGAGPTTSLAPGADASKLSPDAFMKLSDDDLMKAVSSGKIPDDIAKDPKAMMALQQRMNQITEMNQLMTSMLKAIHDMRMSIIQNLRV